MDLLHNLLSDTAGAEGIGFIFPVAAVEKAVVVVGIFDNVLSANCIHIQRQFQPYFVAATDLLSAEVTEVQSIQQSHRRGMLRIDGQLHPHHPAFLVGTQKQPVKTIFPLQPYFVYHIEKQANPN